MSRHAGPPNTNRVLGRSYRVGSGAPGERPVLARRSRSAWPGVARRPHQRGP
jgi:hypothetical protein